MNPIKRRTIINREFKTKDSPSDLRCAKDKDCEDDEKEIFSRIHFAEWRQRDTSVMRSGKEMGWTFPVWVHL